MKLLDFISIGEENAISTGELVALTGMRAREVTRGINQLRNAGEIICSSGAGYFFPADDDDVLRFVRQMRSRQREIGRAAKGARDYLKSGKGGS